MGSRKKLDEEVQATQKVEELMVPLSHNAQMRVLRYCLERAYERATGRPAPPSPMAPSELEGEPRLRFP